MIPNGQWMRDVPADKRLFWNVFRRASYPVTTIVAVVNCFYATGSITRRTLSYAAMPASYFFVYVFPSLKDVTNFALDSVLDVALDAPPLRWICPIDDAFNPFDGLDMRFLNSRSVNDHDDFVDVDLLLNHEGINDRLRKHI
ncbi:uncharacterized protein LOC142336401 [Convolutriloba macropyga]|uniref:uncharacterized protein LOC142336401 n=1 Tax=Convolutriloba macropyga TaxID=536237 RepID=UPI003F51DC96